MFSMKIHLIKRGRFFWIYLLVSLALISGPARYAEADGGQSPVPGTVVGWGNNYYGQATPPPGLSDVIAIAAGGSHSLALKSDGTLVGWGDNNFGQATPPPGLSGVTAVAAGLQHSLALLSDGTVVGWGWNNHGQATPTPGLSGVTAIAAGNDHSLALMSDGTVVGWGNNDYGRATPPPGLSGVIAITAGWEHSLALKNDGTVVGWGGDGYGQLDAPTGLNSVIAITTGEAHSLALKSDGTVVGWGCFLSDYGQCTPPPGLNGVTAISAGNSDSMALLSDGTVIGWGRGIAAPPPGLSGVLAIATSGSHSLAIVTSDLPGPFSKILPADGQEDVSLEPNLTWQSSPGAASYEYCLDATANQQCDSNWISTGADTSAVLSGLSSGSTYFWQVRAVNTNSTSEADGGGWWQFTTIQQSGFEFSGFFKPVKNPPAVNLVRAGNAVPIKFSLNGYQGLDIFAPGYPLSQAINCTTGSPEGDIMGASHIGSKQLSYNKRTDIYTYTWKTKKSWSGTCRQLVVTLVDGTIRVAIFRFK